MRSLLSTLLLVLVPACAAVAADTVIQDVRAPELAGAHAYLGSRLDPSRPVYLLEDELMEHGLLGLATRGGEDGYVITVDPRLDHWTQQMVLIHEWAHVLVWEQGLDNVDPHGVEWGAAYSRVFKAWAGEAEK